MRGIEKLVPGLQAVDLECPSGHRLLLLTGPAVHPGVVRAARPAAGPPSPDPGRWRRFVARQRRLWRRHVDGR